MTLDNTDTEIDPFEAAFKELSELEAKGEEPEVNDKPVEAAVEIPKVDEPVVEEPVASETVETPAVEEPVVEEPKSDPTQDLISKFSEIIERTKPVKEEPTQQQVQQEVVPEIYSKDEEAFLKTYDSDWPDVRKGEALIRKQEYHHLLGYVFKEVAGQLKPMMETLQTLAERTHYGDITAQVSDYSDIRDKVVEWAGNQPSYLQGAYKHVIEHGTVDEIKDLIDRYKRENGGQSVTTQTPTQKTVVELPTATKQAAAALAPVKSKRSVVKSDGPDLNDFDSAFAAFSKED